MSINTQPFYIGDRVVATDDIMNGEGDSLKKGQEFNVVDLMQCPKCSLWLVDVGQIVRPGINRCLCKHHLDNSRIGWVDYHVLALIQRSYTNITKELATKPVEERLDVPKINEPILS